MFLYSCTRLSVENFEYLEQALKADRPLITITNHHATIDDPLLFGLLNIEALKSDRMRWSLGAQEICFKNSIFSRFFSAGRVIPIVRGAGIYQEGMNHALDVLHRKGWVHLFPEAKVNVEYWKLLQFRWGVGHLIHKSKLKPIVVPFYHKGMGDIRPEKYKWGLKVGKELKVIFGPPVDFDQYQFSKENDEIQRMELTSFLQDKVQVLKNQMDKKQ
jgi:monolysocardiolipin acyltransferase